MYREAQRAALDHLLVGARNGEGAALVLRGEPGIGRSTLLDWAAGAATGMAVLRTAGVEAESTIRLAGVHRLIASLLGDIEAVPKPQGQALATALGLVAAPPPDPLFVCLGVLGLLTRAAGGSPLLCLVDDAQWLDRESSTTLAFVARRLDGESIAMVFAVREPAEPTTALAGLPELAIPGLADHEAAELVGPAVEGHLDAAVRERLVAEANGNPLALLELASVLTPQQLAGASALPDPLAGNGGIEEGFLRRARALPDATQTLLLLLAAERLGDLDVVWGAAGALGIASASVAPAEAAGLLALEPQLSFRHPLIRSAIFRGGRPEELRRVHRALGKAAERQGDADSRAWYRGASVVEPDEEIAGDLAGAAQRTQVRTGFSAATPIFARAAELTPDPAHRAARTFAAASAAFAAGDSGRAATLLATAAPQLVDERQQIGAARLQRGIDYELARPGPTPVMLLELARSIEPVDVEMARGVHLEALFAALTACRLGSPDGVRAAATAALAAPAAATGEETAADLLLAGFGMLFAHGHAAAQSPLRSAVDRLRRSEDPYLLTLGAAAARELWDDEAVQALSTRAVASARDTGALGALARALNAQAGTYDVVVGAFDAADGHVQEAREIRTAIAPAVADRGKAVAMLVAAWRGQEDVARALAQGVTLDASARGQGMEISSAQHALAVLELGSIRYPQAMVAAQDATDYPTLLVVTAALPELVEAAVRCDERDVAAAAVDRVAESALPAGTRWALGTLAHCGALIADDDEAEPLYREAISELKQSRAVPRLARTHLVYGEWLRRRRRRLDAREELRRAQEMFVAMGASAFAERARIELVATGERAQPRTFAAAERLTPQELRIANLVAEGLSNPQIAGQLLISRRTVEYHLHKIFRKLGVSSRTQVARELHERPDSVQLH